MKIYVRVSHSSFLSFASIFQFTFMSKWIQFNCDFDNLRQAVNQVSLHKFRF